MEWKMPINKYDKLRELKNIGYLMIVVIVIIGILRTCWGEQNSNWNDNKDLKKEKLILWKI